MEDVPTQPCGRHWCQGLSGRAGGRLQAALCLGHFEAPALAADIARGDDQSDGPMDRPTDHRGLSLGRVTWPSRSGPRRRLWSCRDPSALRNGHSRSPHGPTLTLAEWHTERLISSIRRECLDHIVVFGEAHLRRTRLSLGKDSPTNLPIQWAGQLNARPMFGGPHRQYCRM